MKALFLAAALMLILPLPALAQQNAEEIAALRAQDVALAKVVERLQAANLPMCAERMPLTGMIYHTRDQYGAPPAAWFANGPVSVAAVVPGGPAEAAGIATGDALVALNGAQLATLVPEKEHPQRDAVFSLIARSADAPLRFVVRRDGVDREVVLEAPAGCRILAEILTSNAIRALSDGRVLQVSYGLASRLTEDELAVVAAHELSHAILAHRWRLTQAGVKKGLLAEFGRNRRLGRQVEVEADRLSVHLLANAGYDPAIAPAFWRSEAGDAVDGGLLRSGVYPSRQRRGEIVAEEIAEYLVPRDGPSWPAHLLDMRTRPLED